MGKFLKIIRYIANLIAIMGACFSKAQKNDPNSSLTQSLLDSQTKRSDFKPDQDVGGVSSEISETPKGGSVSNETVSSKKPCFFQQGSGRFVKSRSTSMILQYIFFKSFNGIAAAYVNLIGSTYVLTVVVVDTSRNRLYTDYSLPNYDDFLEGRIDEKSFKDTLLKCNKGCNLHVIESLFAILTHPGDYYALYY